MRVIAITSHLLDKPRPCSLDVSNLVRQNLRVALVEAGDLTKVQDWSMPSDMFSNRVSSLTNASQSFLNGMVQLLDLLYGSSMCYPTAIDAWGFVDATRTSAVEQMQVPTLSRFN